MAGRNVDINFIMPFEVFKLYSSATNFFVVPQEPMSSTSEILVIDRISKEISLKRIGFEIPVDAELKTIFGIFGIIRLVAGPYLIVITKRERVGTIANQSIWKVTGTEIIPYQRSLFHLNEKQVQDNTKYLSMVEAVLSMEHFYYSVNYDITYSMQRLHDTSPDFKKLALHERADQRFVWNAFILRELTQQSDLSRFCIPLMLGFIEVSDIVIKGRQCKYTLVSRRSCLRAGTRYYRRGVDSEGNAANFVETEQILEIDKIKCSFVQTRGSVPLFWSQYPNLYYKPVPVISTTLNHLDGLKRHFSSQEFYYQNQVLVNLLDQKNPELRLVNAYRRTVDTADDPYLRLESFDFHKECSKMRYHRLSLLMDRLSEELQTFGYFMVKDSSEISKQSGVFRTNCIDCLDRTNVVQSMLATKSLENQLVKSGLFVLGERLENENEFHRIFKNVWADNADYLAKQYAGTGALKTDFTRTGKRTFIGSLRDGVNSAIRYILNNFFDGFRQDSMDLFLGNYEVDESEGTITRPSPLRAAKDGKFYALPAVFMVTLSMVIVSFIIPDENWTQQLMYVMFWGGASLATLGAIVFYGESFVDKPKLAKIE